MVELGDRRPRESLRGPLEEAAMKVNQRRKQLIKVCSNHMSRPFSWLLSSSSCHGSVEVIWEIITHVIMAERAKNTKYVIYYSIE